MDARELFEANLDLIDQVARMVCARRRLGAEDVEDFVSAARLSLLEDDYTVLRRYEGRSSLAAFLAVVFDHLLSDQRIHALGKWHPSRAAERLGPAAVLLETLVHRDRRSIDEALPIVRQLDGTLQRSDLESMVARFPGRIPRPRAVPIEDDAEIPVAAPERGDEQTTAREERSLAARTSTVIRGAIAALDREDRMLLRLHFGSKVSIADVSRMLRVPQRPLYRRLESLLKGLRGAIETARLDPGSILELIGAATTEMNFGLQTTGELEMTSGRPSVEIEVASAGDERS